MCLSCDEAPVTSETDDEGNESDRCVWCTGRGSGRGFCRGRGHGRGRGRWGGCVARTRFGRGESVRLGPDCLLTLPADLLRWVAVNQPPPLQPLPTEIAPPRRSSPSPRRSPRPSPDEHTHTENKKCASPRPVRGTTENKQCASPCRVCYVGAAGAAGATASSAVVDENADLADYDDNAADDAADALGKCRTDHDGKSGESAGWDVWSMMWDESDSAELGTWLRRGRLERIANLLQLVANNRGFIFGRFGRDLLWPLHCGVVAHPLLTEALRDVHPLVSLVCAYWRGVGELNFDDDINVWFIQTSHYTGFVRELPPSGGARCHRVYANNVGFGEVTEPINYAHSPVCKPHDMHFSGPSAVLTTTADFHGEIPLEMHCNRIPWHTFLPPRFAVPSSGVLDPSKHRRWHMRYPNCTDRNDDMVELHMVLATYLPVSDYSVLLFYDPFSSQWEVGAPFSFLPNRPPVPLKHPRFTMQEIATQIDEKKAVVLPDYSLFLTMPDRPDERRDRSNTGHKAFMSAWWSIANIRHRRYIKRGFRFEPVKPPPLHAFRPPPDELSPSKRTKLQPAT